MILFISLKGKKEEKYRKESSHGGILNENSAALFKAEVTDIQTLFCKIKKLVRLKLFPLSLYLTSL